MNPSQNRAFAFLKRWTAFFCFLPGLAISQEAPSSEKNTNSPYVPTDYTQVFADEFNESKLDLTQWWTRYIYKNGMQDTLNNEKQRYRENENHQMTGSALKLITKKATADSTPEAPYDSGMIRSKKTFKYGYYESRAKIPEFLGVRASMWLTSDATPDGVTSWPPEINIFSVVINVKEDMGPQKNDSPNMVFTGVANRNKQYPNLCPWGVTNLFLDPSYSVAPKDPGAGSYHAPFKFTEDFHVFGALWEEDDTVTVFIDGKKIVKRSYRWVNKEGIEAPFAHLMFTLAVGGSWAGRFGIEDASFPQSMEIDYVRVYQRKDKILTGQSTIGRDLLYLLKSSNPAP